MVKLQGLYHQNVEGRGLHIVKGLQRMGRLDAGAEVCAILTKVIAGELLW